MARSIVVTEEFYDYLCYIRERDFKKVKGKPISVPKMLFEILTVWNNVRGYSKYQGHGNKRVIPDVCLGSPNNGKLRRNLQKGEVRNRRGL